MPNTGAYAEREPLSDSRNGGRTFTGTTIDQRMMPVVTTAPRQARTDQWTQWPAFTPDGTPG